MSRLSLGFQRSAVRNVAAKLRPRWIGMHTNIIEYLVSASSSIPFQDLTSATFAVRPLKVPFIHYLLPSHAA